eukprot:1551659-Rhodomonas_salina.5
MEHCRSIVLVEKAGANPEELSVSEDFQRLPQHLTVMLRLAKRESTTLPGRERGGWRRCLGGARRWLIFTPRCGEGSRRRIARTAGRGTHFGTEFEWLGHGDGAMPAPDVDEPELARTTARWRAESCTSAESRLTSTGCGGTDAQRQLLVLAT